MSLFDDLDARRESAGISQKDLCAAAGVSPASYWKWRSGKDGITARNLERLQASLGRLINERNAA